MPLKHAILGLLADGPVHGYDLRTAWSHDLAPTDNLNFGQVYTTLDRLHRDGWVLNRRIAQSERPDKKVYELTPQGREQLHAWLEAPSPLELDLRNEAFLKIMTARRLPGFDPHAVIDTERRACLLRLHEMNRAKVKAETEGAPLQSLMLLELALLRLEAFAKWLDRCESLLARE